MPYVLVSFIGTGHRANEKTPGRYITTQYRFADEDVVETDLFGVALLHHLKSQGRTVDTWLLLGTKQSNWDVLHSCVPDNEQIQEQALEIAHRVEKGLVDQSLLDAWASALQDAGMTPKPVPCLVGPCDTPHSQSALWNALLDNLPNDSHVFMDITHGLRHQPVLATFMLGLLRTLREISLEGVYYGALELKQDNLAPVLELDWCRQLFDLTESLATMKNTGVITPLVSALGISGPVSGKLHKFAVLDDLMHPNASAEMARQLVGELSKLSLSSPIHQSLLPEMQKRIQEVSKGNRSDHLIDRAQNSWKRKSYSKALLELQEAIMSCVRDKYGIKDDEAGNRQIKSVLKHYSGPYCATFDTLKNLRDGVAHGFTNEHKINDKDIDEIGKLFDEGVKMYFAIKRGEIHLTF